MSVKGIIVCFFFATAIATTPPIDEELWLEAQEYLLPEDHPIKSSLDTIFSKKNIIYSKYTMKKAGFTPYQDKDKTKIYAAKHRLLKGYVVKGFLDVYHGKNKNILEAYVKRAKGARIVQAVIDLYDLSHHFKVPKKWIYPLPESASSEHLFILIAEDMRPLNRFKNSDAWYQHTSIEMLKELHLIVNEGGLSDCVSSANIPFCKDGKIAFVDFQRSLDWPIDYARLNKSLNPKMKRAWIEITQ